MRGRAPQMRGWLASPRRLLPFRWPEARGADGWRGPRYASGARGARPYAPVPTAFPEGTAASHWERLSRSGHAGDLAHLVGRVQGGHLVGLGQRRVVEHGVDQVVHGAATAHHGLADMHKLGRPGAEDVHAE